MEKLTVDMQYQTTRVCLTVLTEDRSTRRHRTATGSCGVNQVSMTRVCLPREPRVHLIRLCSSIHAVTPNQSENLMQFCHENCIFVMVTAISSNHSRVYCHCVCPDVWDVGSGRHVSYCSVMEKPHHCGKVQTPWIDRSTNCRALSASFAWVTI